MAGYKGHLFWAVCTYGLVLCLSSLISWPVCYSLQNFISVLLGALFPDVDTKSKGQKIFYWLLLITLFYTFMMHWYCTSAVLVLLGFLPLMSSHRGLFHNLWFLIFLITIITLFLGRYCGGFTHCLISNAVFFFLGVLSHLIVDFGFYRAIRL